ncbi:glutathione S-transferase family protein [Nevskia ramosa]|uniref:glutathione S-transferase family protein n=1 Tax=Nevskia ramosa TaxID=64002 RepID=UPI0003B78BBE|nr:glutathione S-transferase family protein [Nevskia ramosa]
MKLINSFGPNPRIVRMFLAEKGLSIPSTDIDMLGGENRKPPYTDKNPGGQTPSLELDDGSVLGETVVICEYLEEKHPTPALIGSNAQERAEARQWQRRVELNITEYIYNAFRYSEGLGLFKDRVHCIPAAAPDMKVSAQSWLKKLDGLIAGRDFIAGKQLRLVDIVLYCCLDFAKDVGQPLDPSNANIAAWFKRVDSRPSATASLSSNWADMKMRG